MLNYPISASFFFFATSSLIISAAVQRRIKTNHFLMPTPQVQHLILSQILLHQSFSSLERTRGWAENENGFLTILNWENPAEPLLLKPKWHFESGKMALWKTVSSWKKSVESILIESERVIFSTSSYTDKLNEFE